MKNSIHLTGCFDKSNEKRCGLCEHFLLWGTTLGGCLKHANERLYNESCEDFQKSRDDEEYML
ncbi:hypothetical protein ABEO76_21240 [Bacillus anthracis]|uniref:hypothetical protein n=1 Tax=Bacillus anthracis TaxID=1392 RepID=UPI003D231FF1